MRLIKAKTANFDRWYDLVARLGTKGRLLLAVQFEVVCQTFWRNTTE